MTKKAKENTGDDALTRKTNSASYDADAGRLSEEKMTTAPTTTKKEETKAADKLQDQPGWK